MTNDCNFTRIEPVDFFKIFHKHVRKMAKDKKKKGPPPADYVCAACKEGGHWVFDCTQVLLLLLLFFPPRLCCCIE